MTFTSNRDEKYRNELNSLCQSCANPRHNCKCSQIPGTKPCQSEPGCYTTSEAQCGVANDIWCGSSQTQEFQDNNVLSPNCQVRSNLVPKGETFHSTDCLQKLNGENFNRITSDKCFCATPWEKLLSGGAWYAVNNTR